MVWESDSLVSTLSCNYFVGAGCATSKAGKLVLAFGFSPHGHSQAKERASSFGTLHTCILLGKQSQNTDSREKCIGTLHPISGEGDLGLYSKTAISILM